MTPIDKILVPVDLSPSSKTVVAFAAELARANNARLIFLHVINQSIIDAVHQLSSKGYKGDFVQGMRKLVQERERDLEALVPEEHRKTIDVELLVRKGDPAEKILQAARDLSVKLIILGSIARQGEGEVSSGDIIQQIIGGAPCSILLARPV